MNQDHKTLNKVAARITDWDEVNTLGLELDCDPNEIKRLMNENISIKGASYKILSSFYEGSASPDQAKWTRVRHAMKELGKEAAIVDLGINKLCGEPNANIQPSSGETADQKPLLPKQATGAQPVTSPTRGAARNNPTGVKPASRFTTSPVGKPPPSFAASSNAPPKNSGNKQTTLGGDEAQEFTISPQLIQKMAGELKVA